MADNGGDDWFVKSINPTRPKARLISRLEIKYAGTSDLDSTWIPPKFRLAPMVAPPTGVPILPDT